MFSRLLRPKVSSPGGVIENLEISARTALAAALRVSFQRGGHDWMLMRDACMSIVELQVESVDDDIHDRHSKTDGTEGGVARDGERSAAKESTVQHHDDST